MKREYFFSIIIPTFNVEKTIEKCLQSIFDQSFSDFEIFIMDGKSTDRTLSIISSFNSSKIKVFSETDQGIYDAMNKGIGLANGEFLYFIGGDDTLFGPDVLIHLSTIINPNEDRIVYGNVKMNGSNKWVKDGTVYGGVFDLKRILSHNISHQAILYHYSVFDTLGKFNLHYPILADHDFNIKAASQFNFKYCEIIVANFCVGGSSTQNTDRFEEDRVANIVEYFKNILTSKRFIPLRYYIRQAAFNPRVKVDFRKKMYYSLVYLRLKAQSLIH